MDENSHATASIIKKFNNAVKSKRENIFKDFKIVKDEDIRKYYLYESYESDNHTLGGSCMRYEKCQKYLDIYVKNPEVCQLLILKSDDDKDKIKGRALIWKLTNGEYYMDRIYLKFNK